MSTFFYFNFISHKSGVGGGGGLKPPGPSPCAGPALGTLFNRGSTVVSKGHLTMNQNNTNYTISHLFYTKPYIHTGILFTTFTNRRVCPDLQWSVSTSCKTSLSKITYKITSFDSVDLFNAYLVFFVSCVKIWPIYTMHMYRKINFKKNTEQTAYKGNVRAFFEAFTWLQCST